MSMGDFDLRLAAVKRLKPVSGFNVVGVDSYERDPAYELFLVGHYNTREEAESVLADSLKKARETDPDATFYIYDSE
jgi:hypothetical protein